MNSGKMAAFLVAVCAFGAVAPTLRGADPRESHRPISPPGSIDEDKLRERGEGIQGAQDLSAFQALLKKMAKDPKNYNLDTKTKRDFLEKALADNSIQKMINDPKMKGLLRDALKNPKLSEEHLKALGRDLDKLSPEQQKALAELAKNNKPGDFNLTPQELEELKRLTENGGKAQTRDDLARWKELGDKISQNPNLPPGDVDIEALKRTVPDIPPLIPNDNNPVEKPVDDIIPPPEIPRDLAKPDAAPANTEDRLEERILDKVGDWWEDYDPDGTHLDSLAKWVHDAIEKDGQEGWAKAGLLKSFDYLEAVRSSEWGQSDVSLKAAGSWFDLFHAPSLPKGGSTGGTISTSGGTTSSSGSSTLETEQVARFFIWSIVAVVLGVAGWRLLVWYRAYAARNSGLGRWPVRPGAVATRGELVRAFEYLALLCLGVDAKHRHHLDLAERLGRSPTQASDDARQEAANHLAHLYELARYAPEDEPLLDAEMAAARLDLCYLAGVSAL